MTGRNRWRRVLLNLTLSHGIAAISLYPYVASAVGEALRAR